MIKNIKGDEGDIEKMKSKENRLRAEEKFFGNYENVEYNVFLKICKYLSALRRDKRICICKTEDMLREV